MAGTTNKLRDKMATRGQTRSPRGKRYGMRYLNNIPFYFALVNPGQVFLLQVFYRIFRIESYQTLFPVIAEFDYLLQFQV